MNPSAMAGSVRTALIVLVCWLGLTVAAAAQTAPSPDYDVWSQISVAAQEALESDDTSGEQLEELRGSLATWRNEFLEAQDTNAARIATLEGQLDALGPPPAEGEPEEAADTAERRSTLNAQLEEARAPVMRAEEAYTLADSLIAQIDATVRDRFARELLARQSTPLNPANWGPVIATVVDGSLAIWNETRSRLLDPAARSHTSNELAVAVPLLVIGLMLVFRSRWWIRLFASWIVSQSTKGRGVLEFILSLGQVILPAAGVFVLTRALRLTGLAGPEGEQLIGVLPFVALPIIVAKWLSQASFPTEKDARGILGFAKRYRDRLRLYANTMAVLVGLLILVRGVGDVTGLSEVSIAVLQFPVWAVLSLALYRFGRILMRSRAVEQPSGSVGARYATGLRQWVGRVLIAIAITGIIVAAFGYANAARALLLPAVVSLALTAFLLLLQKLVSDLYAFLTGQPEGQTDALAPVLIGFALTLSALPFYALVWGARVTDLTELWTRFRAGFALGDTRISPADFMVFLLIFAAGYMLTRFVQGTLRNTILPKTKMDVGGRNAIVSGLGYIGIFVAAIVAITTAGIDLSSLAIVAGALSVGIGFGLQNVVSNFVSGIILLIERPISEGDWIEVNGRTGYVRDISVRSTRIETFDRTDVIVPNADLVSGTVTNWTRGNLVGRVIVPVGVPYGTDTRQVAAILSEVAEAHPMVVLNPRPFIYFKEFGADALNFEIRAILRDVNFVLQVQSEMNHEIIRKFDAAGITIPFPQREIWLRNPEALNMTFADTPGGAPEG